MPAAQARAAQNTLPKAMASGMVIPVESGAHNLSISYSSKQNLLGPTFLTDDRMYEMFPKFALCVCLLLWRIVHVRCLHYILLRVCCPSLLNLSKQDPLYEIQDVWRVMNVVIFLLYVSISLSIYPSISLSMYR